MGLRVAVLCLAKWMREFVVEKLASPVQSVLSVGRSSCPTSESDLGESFLRGRKAVNSFKGWANIILNPYGLRMGCHSRSYAHEGRDKNININHTGLHNLHPHWFSGHFMNFLVLFFSLVRHPKEA